MTDSGTIYFTLYLVDGLILLHKNRGHVTHVDPHLPRGCIHRQQPEILDPHLAWRWTAHLLYHWVYLSLFGL